MNIIATLKMVGTLFIITAALLMVLLVINVVDSQETRDTLVKVASVLGILAVASIGISYLTGNKS